MPSVFTVYDEMLPGLGKVQGGLLGGIEELLLRMKSTPPEGASNMAVGTLPVGCSPPLAVRMPVVRSMLYAETDESPWVATNRAAVPVADELLLLLLQEGKPNNKTGRAIPARNRNLVPILFNLPVLSQAFLRAECHSRRRIEVQKHPHLCIRNNREEQPALAGWNHAGARKLPAFCCPAFHSERAEPVSTGSPG